MTDLIEKLKALPVYGRVRGTAQGQMVLLEDVLEAVRQHAATEQPVELGCREALQKISDILTKGKDVEIQQHEIIDICLITHKALAAPARELDWVRVSDFRGEPNSSPLAWWWSEAEGTALDEVLLDEAGDVCGKGRCGAQFYTHIALAITDLPKPSQSQIEGTKPTPVARGNLTATPLSDL